MSLSLFSKKEKEPKAPKSAQLSFHDIPKPLTLESPIDLISRQTQQSKSTIVINQTNGDIPSSIDLAPVWNSSTRASAPSISSSSSSSSSPNFFDSLTIDQPQIKIPPQSQLALCAYLGEKDRAIELLKSKEIKANIPLYCHGIGTGVTPLVYASERGHFSLVQMLVEKKALPTYIQNSNALLFAAANGNIDLVKYLLQHGADVNDCYLVDMRNVIHETLVSGQIETFELFWSIFQSQTALPLLTTPPPQNPNVVIDIDIDYCDAEGRTMLHYAAAGGKLVLVQRVIKSCVGRFSLDAQTKTEGRTALHYATQLRCYDVVAFLLTLGCGQNVASYDGVTPHQIAVQMKDQQLLSLFEYGISAFSFYMNSGNFGNKNNLILDDQNNDPNLNQNNFQNTDPSQNLDPNYFSTTPISPLITSHSSVSSISIHSTTSPNNPQELNIANLQTSSSNHQTPLPTPNCNDNEDSINSSHSQTLGGVQQGGIMPVDLTLSRRGSCSISKIGSIDGSDEISVSRVSSLAAGVGNGHGGENYCERNNGIKMFQTSFNIGESIQLNKSRHEQQQQQQQQQKQLHYGSLGLNNSNSNLPTPVLSKQPSTRRPAQQPPMQSVSNGVDGPHGGQNIPNNDRQGQIKDCDMPLISSTSSQSFIFNPKDANLSLDLSSENVQQFDQNDPEKSRNDKNNDKNNEHFSRSHHSRKQSIVSPPTPRCLYFDTHGEQYANSTIVTLKKKQPQQQQQQQSVQNVQQKSPQNPDTTSLQISTPSSSFHNPNPPMTSSNVPTMPSRPTRSGSISTPYYDTQLTKTTSSVSVYMAQTSLHGLPEGGNYDSNRRGSLGQNGENQHNNDKNGFQGSMLMLDIDTTPQPTPQATPRDTPSNGIDKGQNNSSNTPLTATTPHTRPSRPSIMTSPGTIKRSAILPPMVVETQEFDQDKNIFVLVEKNNQHRNGGNKNDDEKNEQVQSISSTPLNTAPLDQVTASSPPLPLTKRPLRRVSLPELSPDPIPTPKTNPNTPKRDKSIVPPRPNRDQSLVSPPQRPVRETSVVPPPRPKREPSVALALKKNRQLVAQHQAGVGMDPNGDSQGADNGLVAVPGEVSIPNVCLPRPSIGAIHLVMGDKSEENITPNNLSTPLEDERENDVNDGKCENSDEKSDQNNTDCNDDIAIPILEPQLSSKEPVRPRRPGTAIAGSVL
jgi:hypothetical protein